MPLTGHMCACKHTAGAHIRLSKYQSCCHGFIINCCYHNCSYPLSLSLSLFLSLSLLSLSFSPAIYISKHSGQEAQHGGSIPNFVVSHGSMFSNSCFLIGHHDCDVMGHTFRPYPDRGLVCVSRFVGCFWCLEGGHMTMIGVVSRLTSCHAVFTHFVSHNMLVASISVVLLEKEQESGLSVVWISH